jgi:hypothetical protein
MIQKTILNQKRVRTIQSSFAYIEHRFVSDGFLKRLNHHDLLLYFFLVLAADRNGLSYYSYRLSENSFRKAAGRKAYHPKGRQSYNRALLQR